MQAVNTISARLSLREPQRESLRILARIAEIVPLSKERDVHTALEIVRSEFPQVREFERDFPSLCFALATGVGKTRLMGAFIAYLRSVHGIRHYFVLAPNLTIYEKLIREFTPGHPKYVFQGVPEFATDPPELITGDNYESGRGVRNAQYDVTERDVHVNIFNISKINTEVRSGASPRIKRLQEYIGESYFEYLSALDDLVLLMDESHRYRATAGVRVLNELNPVLGLELTATPQVERGNRGAEAFRNVIYSYPLANAIRDGFVKEPAVATRENFNAAAHTLEQLERIKLEDGIRIHEHVKVDLDTYSRQAGRDRVKPFLLIVARDVEHATALRLLIESNSFFDGAYRGKVIDVHSRQGAEERDDNVQRLLAVERVDEPTEIVIHVNMLKEGWDVTNLYTIVPLRAADSRTLVEQSIGRGLRLPYGRRTGVAAIDRLTIVAHDKFQEIVDEANRPGSQIHVQTVFIGRDVPEGARRVVTVAPSAYEAVGMPPGDSEDDGEQRRIAGAVVQAIELISDLPSSAAVLEAHGQERLLREVSRITATDQLALGEDEFMERLRSTVPMLAASIVERGIDIPEIVIAPRGQVSAGFTDFDLDVAGINLRPVAQDILIQHLQSHQRQRLLRTEAEDTSRPEDYLVRALAEREDVDYASHATLLYKLAGQVVAHLRSYLDEAGVMNVMQYHQQRLADLVHAQLRQHWVEEAPAGYEARVVRGFVPLRPLHFATSEDTPRDFRAPVDNPSAIRMMSFAGFRKSLYGQQKFDSDPERRFAVLLEDDPAVAKWTKLPPRTLRIHYDGSEAYEPDFVVETADHKYLCEPKRDSEMHDPVVVAKADAAVRWCEYATEHELAHGGKPWNYLLIPESAISAEGTLAGLTASWTFAPAKSAEGTTRAG